MFRRVANSPIAFASIALLVLLSLYLWHQLRHVSRQAPYARSDSDVIEAARRSLKADYNATDYDIRNRFAVVVPFEDARCVALRVPRGFLGNTPVYCFDNNLQPVDVQVVPLQRNKSSR